MVFFMHRLYKYVVVYVLLNVKLRILLGIDSVIW